MRNAICVIDDDEIYQKIIKKLISRANVFEEAYFYASGKEAIDDFLDLKTNLPSIILLDINMPIMDGWQFLDRLEKLYPLLYENTKVFIVTSSIAYSDKEKMMEFPGVSGFLSKPLNIEKLKEIGSRQ
ncbi:response regulator [Christiangramia forsetii]|uniref:Protein containing response regulator receiver domain n=2 Tax=Christiangramia forsetii TaxID=411153 RepID=A0LXP3_CHRFK|nr:response regulator [Christiangramia forsetii]GGG36300.1 response regulator [Christiangramia forsetii]CAL65138.1 protein containing response regulator receiver domain [Christiangramia forsetii KT0803]